MNNISRMIEEKIVPFASKLAENDFIAAISAGMMGVLPITLGTSVIAILGNLPIDALTQFLMNTGLYGTVQDFIALTMSLTAIYMTFTIGYSFANRRGKNALTGGVLSAAAFISLLPIISLDGVAALATANLGSTGIFVAMIVSLLASWLYCILLDKHITLKLPATVPPMVSDSMSPTFTAMIIFVIFFAIRFGLSQTQYGDAFNLIGTIVSKPIMAIGTSVGSLIIVFMIQNIGWFFGLHPSVSLTYYIPVLIAAGTANAEAFVAGAPLPYFTFMTVYTAVFVGGAGNTLGLCLAMFFAKSDKYKAMRKVVIPANIFNINEPIIFGFPLMLNPIYFIPMAFTSAVSGGIAYLLISANLIPINYNPTVSMPWVTPGFVTAFLQGGFGLFAIWLIAFLIHFLMYLPFFMIDDKRALKEEQEQLETNV